MKFTPIDPPREFTLPGGAHPITMRDCGRVRLEPDEQVSFVTGGGGEYDVARKSWGYYATPSLNARLKQFGLRPALVKSTSGRYYIFLQEAGKEAEYDSYLTAEKLHTVCWLDNEAVLADISRLFGRGT